MAAERRTQPLVALLQGINVGRSRRIAMADLRAALEGAGFAGVRTQGQSGNLVLDAPLAPDEAARAIEAVIAERFGVDVDVVGRTPAELAAVVAADPLRDVATDGARHVVIFLAEPPAPGQLGALDTRALASERFVVSGREIHARCPDGLRNSPLMKALTPRRGGPVATARNWNTVTKLLAMVAEGGSGDAGR